MPFRRMYKNQKKVSFAVLPKAKEKPKFSEKQSFLMNSIIYIFLPPKSDSYFCVD